MYPELSSVQEPIWYLPMHITGNQCPTNSNNESLWNFRSTTLDSNLNDEFMLWEPLLTLPSHMMLTTRVRICLLLR